MPLRDFRNVEYYRIKKDNSWDIKTIMIPSDVPYEHCIDYILTELTALGLTDNVKDIAICNFPESFTTGAG